MFSSRLQKYKTELLFMYFGGVLFVCFFLFHSAKSKGSREPSCIKARRNLLRQKARGLLTEEKN